MLKKMAHFIVQRGRIIEKFFIAMTILCAVCYPFVGVNYDLSKYLPDFAPTKQALDVMEQGRIQNTAGHQGRDRDQAPVTGRELVLPRPNLAKKHVVIQFREFGGKFAHGVSARSYLFHEISVLSVKLILISDIPRPPRAPATRPESRGQR